MPVHAQFVREIPGDVHRGAPKDGRRPAEAEKLFHRELEARCRVEGASSSQVPRRVGAVVATLDQQNGFANAEALYRDTVAQQSAPTAAASAETARDANGT